MVQRSWGNRSAGKQLVIVLEVLNKEAKSTQANATNLFSTN